jgi:hypothetical protein
MQREAKKQANEGNEGLLHATTGTTDRETGTPSRSPPAECCYYGGLGPYLNQ